MSETTYVIIPFKDEADMTIALLCDLIEQGGYDQILLFDNGSSQGELDRVQEAAGWESIRIISRPDSRIYEMWNEGWRMCEDMSPNQRFNLCILNNDIAIPDNFLATMADKLRSKKSCWAVYPDYDLKYMTYAPEELKLKETSGTYQHGGLCGWAFMLKGEAPIDHVDERFQWWYGDDDLVRKITAAGGKTCRIVGLPLRHVGEATASNGKNDWTHRAKREDEILYNELWRS
jgi:hypothetical protein